MSRGKSNTEVYSNFAAYLRSVAEEARSPEKLAETASWVVEEARKKMLEKAAMGDPTPVVRVSWGFRYTGPLDKLHDAVLTFLSDDLVCSQIAEGKLEFGVWGHYFGGSESRGRVSSVRCG